MDPMPTFHQSVLSSVRELQKKALMVTYRNKPFIFGRLLMTIIMGFIYCTGFYQFDPTQISVVMGVTFATAMFLSLGQGFQTPVYIGSRDVFYKQRGAHFFLTGSYVLATTSSQIPLALTETIIFGSIVWFRISDYLHWISPIAWALKVLAINQYQSSELDVCVYDVVNIGVPVMTVEDESPKTKDDDIVAVDLPVENRDKNFMPVTVAFKDLHYLVPDPKNPKHC
ncbi:hypothetical protein JG688_00014651 [Phytophthora aleatoria]|uniref:ABC-2 type transporter transmembrane domain-containing protein n=1 Tax=Phytophthora aleatoria TaxID=2496075 RepID=A0A8J5J0C0_9STRA|nr:hypothetical protein JG688_00014651 [Phytophthora aleatoria]